MKRYAMSLAAQAARLLKSLTPTARPDNVVGPLCAADPRKVLGAQAQAVDQPIKATRVSGELATGDAQARARRILQGERPRGDKPVNQLAASHRSGR